VEPDTPHGSNIATADDVRIAIQAISVDDGLRLNRAARLCLPGTEFRDPKEILNEAIVRCLSGSRQWRHHEVPFVAFMINTMKSIADASRAAPAQSRTDSAFGPGPHVTHAGHADPDLIPFHTSTEDAVIEAEDLDARRQAAAADAATIEEYFEGDEDVFWLILCYKQGQSPSKGRELADLTATQYQTTRKRFRRGLLKLFPERSPA
jgi:hypothetical protein